MSHPGLKLVLLAATALTATAPAMARDGRDGRERGGRDRVRTEISPYIEFDQVALADLKSGDVLTYSVVAAGVDGSIATQRVQGQLSLRYERIIGYDDDIDDEDVISGIGRVGVTIARGLTIEAGALGARTRTDSRGAVPGSLVGNPDNISQVYSAYVGPTYSGQVGDLSVNAAYRVGYTKVEEKNALILAPGQAPVDLFDDSVSQSAAVSVGMQPGDLPFGWSVGAGWDREDADQLDQRFDAKHVRADVTLPVTPTLAVVGGVGYEDIEISERDALRDAVGVPLVDGNGRLITDPSSPRLLSYDDDGVIWDVGVLWRPSSRTSVEARIGRRYSSTTYYGSASYQPNENLGFNVSVYDEVTSYGSLLNDGLSRLSTTFRSYRNPIGGDLSGCAFGDGGAFCLNDALANSNSAAFRARGVTASVSAQENGWQYGAALGYSRYKYIAAFGGGQGQIDGIVDQNYFMTAQASRQLDERSGVSGSVYADFINPGLPGAGDVVAVGANAAYNRNIWRGLDATAAVGLDSYKQEDFDSALTASALLGLRYSF